MTFLSPLALLVASAGTTPVYVVSDSPRAREGCRSEVSEFCDGYMLATFDQMSLTGQICPTSSVTVSGAKMLLSDYLRRHPKAEDYSFPSATAEAFKEAFPCPAADK